MRRWVAWLMPLPLSCTSTQTKSPFAGTQGDRTVIADGLSAVIRDIQKHLIGDVRKMAMPSIHRLDTTEKAVIPDESFHYFDSGWGWINRVSG